MKNIYKTLQEKELSIYFLLVVWAILLTLFSKYVINGPDIFDYKFHLTRIVGLAQSINHGDFLPNLNNLFSWGTGYASNMFYGNWQIYIPAIVFLLSKNAILSYSALAFTSILFNSFSSYYFFNKILKDKSKSFWIASALPCLFSYYGFGMTMVVGLLPMLIYSLYKVVYENKNNPILLGVTVALLIQTHILSTLILAIFSLVFLIFNIKRITLKHIISFVISAALGLLLSSGFIIQYVEQTSSQTFFFDWKTRNFPVDSSMMFDLSNNFHSGFSPLTNYYDLPLRLVGIYLITQFKNLQTLSKALLLTAVTMYLMMTPLLPWSSVLRYTILGLLQCTERLSFFSPMIIIVILAIESNRSITRSLSLAIMVMYFFGIVRSEENLVSPNMTNYLNENFRSMQRVFINPMTEFINPVGDEYYTLDINHAEVRDRKFADVSNEKNITVNKVNYGYNKVEIDYKIKDSSKKASLVVPRIYYKGYVAKYLDGASGSQPKLEKAQRTENEIAEAQKLKMPDIKEKVLNNGKIYLQLTKSGRVLVEYKKTKLQYIGYTIELITWLLVLLFSSYSFKNFSKSKK